MVLRALLIQQRESLGLSQEEISKRLGQPKTYCWKVENGERALKYVEAPAYAEALGLTMGEFTARYESLLRMQTIPPKRKRKSDDDR
jgi:transcriptional regulator with XRE-family HTH domain